MICDLESWILNGFCRQAVSPLRGSGCTVLACCSVLIGYEPGWGFVSGLGTRGKAGRHPLPASGVRLGSVARLVLITHRKQQ